MNKQELRIEDIFARITKVEMAETIELRFGRRVLGLDVKASLLEGSIMYIESDLWASGVWSLYSHSDLVIRDNMVDLNMFNVTEREFMQELTKKLTPIKDTLVDMTNEHQRSMAKLRATTNYRKERVKC